MPNLDYDRIRKRLSETFAAAESAAVALEANRIADAQADIDTVFASATQAYREVLLGCILAKLDDASTDVTKPYIALSENAFNGRTLDERVVNPFLHEKRIPSSKGPYLSTFRRSVDFSPATRSGLRDKNGFDALLRLIQRVENDGSEFTNALLGGLLTGFVKLREQSTIPVAKLNRASLIQYQHLIEWMLNTPSGGRIPVVFVIALFHALRQHFGLNWEIESQGINEADSASGAGGDITIRNGSRTVFVAEVTERVVDKSRVISTFNTKISPDAIEDYIFFVNGASSHGTAIAQAQQYFTQGSEVNFVDIRSWLNMSLVTIGKEGRAEFNSQLRRLLDLDTMPRSIKVAWNDSVARLTSV